MCFFSCENNDNTWSFRGGMGLSENRLSEISVNDHHLHICSRDSYVLYLFHSGWFSPYCLSHYCTVVILYIYTYTCIYIYSTVIRIIHYCMYNLTSQAFAYPEGDGINDITTTCHGHGRCKRKLPTRRVRQNWTAHAGWTWHDRPRGTG